jgi:flagellar biosynthesis/type III secretory pathway chaperone
LELQKEFFRGFNLQQMSSKYSKYYFSKDFRFLFFVHTFKVKCFTAQFEDTNLKEDYQRISGIALQLKQNNTINDWIVKKRKNVYVKIDDEFSQCKFKHNWFDKKSN